MTGPRSDATGCETRLLAVRRPPACPRDATADLDRRGNDEGVDEAGEHGEAGQGVPNGHHRREVSLGRRRNRSLGLEEHAVDGRAQP